MALAAPHLALPLLVTVVLSASMNAYFYAAWMIANLMIIGLLALNQTLYASGSGRPQEMWRKLRLTLVLALGAGLAGNLFLLFAGERILGVYGQDYVQNGAPVLRLLALGVFTLTIREHYVTIRRIEGDLGFTTAITAVGGALELVFAGLGAMQGGLVGLATGWLLATCLEALYAGPRVLRTALRPPD
jgi:O-antigen/teichoic acid export membrane protein